MTSKRILRRAGCSPRGWTMSVLAAAGMLVLVGACGSSGAAPAGATAGSASVVTQDAVAVAARSTLDAVLQGGAPLTPMLTSTLQPKDTLQPTGATLTPSATSTPSDTATATPNVANTATAIAQLMETAVAATLTAAVTPTPTPDASATFAAQFATSVAQTLTAQPTNTPSPEPTTAPTPIPTTAAKAQASSVFNPAEEVLIPDGRFQMGCDSTNPQERCNADEQPLHSVFLEAYYIDKYEVTNARYQACAAAGSCLEPQLSQSPTHSFYYGNPDYADYPVIYVTRGQAIAFCKWDNDKRLPTEAEWERAARGDADTRKYPWGNSAPDCSKTNHWDQAGSCVGDANRVGSYPAGASPYGVMDMAGNVSEWVGDLYDANYYSASPDGNPQGAASSWYVVTRGGSWADMDGDGHVVRVAARSASLGDGSYSFSMGFRCVRDVSFHG